MSTTRCSHQTGLAASLRETIGMIEPPVGLTKCRKGPFHPPGNGGKAAAGIVSHPAWLPMRSGDFSGLLAQGEDRTYLRRLHACRNYKLRRQIGSALRGSAYVA